MKRKSLAFGGEKIYENKCSFFLYLSLWMQFTCFVWLVARKQFSKFLTNII